jgi:hypothetical protein
MIASAEATITLMMYRTPEWKIPDTKNITCKIKIILKMLESLAK